MYILDKNNTGWEQHSSTYINQIVPDYLIFFWSAEQFYEHIMQELVKTEINKQSDVKFRLD